MTAGDTLGNLTGLEAEITAARADQRTADEHEDPEAYDEATDRLNELLARYPHPRKG